MIVPVGTWQPYRLWLRNGKPSSSSLAYLLVSPCTSNHISFCTASV